MKFLAMHRPITNQQLSSDIFTVGHLEYLNGTWFNILMIFGIKKWIILTHICIFGYCYNISGATSDWFCAPGSHMVKTDVNEGNKQLICAKCGLFY